MLTTAKLKGDKKLVLTLKRSQQQFINKKILGKLGRYVDLHVMDRTLVGTDSQGFGTGPYKSKWKKVREEAGLQVEFVDLFFTGSMFGALTHKVSADEVNSYFMSTRDSEDESNPEKAAKLDERYHFFGVDAEMQDEIMNLVNAHIKETLHGRK